MREKAPGRWELRVYAGQDDGRKRWVSRTHRGGARSAAKALAALEADVAARRARPVDRVTVAELLERHIAHRSPGWSPNTRRDRRRITDREIVPAIGSRPVRSIRPLDVDDLVANIATTRPPTARNTLAVLRAAFEDGLRWELVDRNPARAARAPSVPSRTQNAPTLTAVTAVIAAAAAEGDQAMATAIRLAAVTGARRGELAALRWSDIDLEARVVMFARSVVSDGGQPVEKTTKTGAVKRVTVDAGTVAALKAWRAASIEEALAFGVRWSDDRYVFARRPDGHEPWGLGTFTHRWRALADAHGLAGVRLHDLRHAMVSQLIGDGFDITVASDRAGHSSRSVTINTYAHALPARDAEAADHLGRLLDG